MTYNPKIKNTSNTDMSIDANVDANNITMGDPDNNNWEDGLFAFSTETKVGAAIDKINELLKGLSPNPPQGLDNISSELVHGVDAGIAFTAGGNTGFVDVVELQGRPATAEREIYSLQDAPDYQRLGAYKTGDSFMLSLNGDKAIDANGDGSIVNLRPDALKVVRGEVSNFKIELNGAEYIISTDLAQDDSQGVQNYGVYADNNLIALSFGPIRDGKHLSTGADFNVFQHRTVTLGFEVDTLDGPTSLQNGFNKIKVYHKIGGDIDSAGYWDDAEVSNWADFIYDPTGAIQSAYSSQNVDISSLESAESDALKTKTISGIKYLSDPALDYSISATISDYATYTFKPNGGITISVADITDQLDLTNGDFDVNAQLDLPSNVLSFSETIDFEDNKRILANNLTHTLSLVNAFDVSKGSSAPFSAAKQIMYDSVDDTSTENQDSEGKIVESFNGENHRVSAGSTAAHSPAIAVDELVVYNGALMAHGHSDLSSLWNNTNLLPAQTLAQTAIGNATYFRKIKNTAGPIANGYIVLDSVGITIDTADSNDIKLKDDNDVEIDILIEENDGNYKSILNNNTGIFAASNAPAGSASNYIGFSLSTGKTWTANTTARVKIVADQSFIGKINTLTIHFI